MFKGVKERLVEGMEKKISAADLHSLCTHLITDQPDSVSKQPFRLLSPTEGLAGRRWSLFSHGFVLLLWSLDECISDRGCHWPSLVQIPNILHTFVKGGSQAWKSARPVVPGWLTPKQPSHER
jgi:hypothetical protein